MKKKSKPTQAVSPKQRDFLDALSQTRANLYTVLNRQGVTPQQFETWLENEAFAIALRLRRRHAVDRCSEALILGLPRAVKRLLDLVKSEKDETARKACLDVLKTACDLADSGPFAEKEQPDIELPEELPPERAEYLLTLLAQHKAAQKGPSDS